MPATTPTPYTSPTAIAQQLAYAESLRGKPMGKHGAGGRTSWADGLAHMLNQYYGGKTANKAIGAEEANTKVRGEDMNRLLTEALSGISLGEGPLKPEVQAVTPNKPYTHPDAQAIALARQLKAIDDEKEFAHERQLQNIKGGDRRGKWKIETTVNPTTGKVEQWEYDSESGATRPYSPWDRQGQQQTPPNGMVPQEMVRGIPNSATAWLTGQQSPQGQDTPAPQPSTQQPTQPPRPGGDPKYDPPTIEAKERAKESAQAWGKLQDNQAQLQIDKPKIKAGLRAATDQHATIANTVQDARKLVDGWTVGMMGNLGEIPVGSPAYDLAQKLLTLQANVGFITLMDMKNNSPTGGALGQVSDKENSLLQAVWGSLAQAQSKEQFLQILDDVEKKSGSMMRSQHETYNDWYGEPWEYKSEILRADEQPKAVNWVIENGKMVQK